MGKIKTILLYVDGSDNSRKAMEQARNFSVIMDAEIVLLYVRGAIPHFIKGSPLDEAEKVQKEEEIQVLAPFQTFVTIKENIEAPGIVIVTPNSINE